MRKISVGNLNKGILCEYFTDINNENIETRTDHRSYCKIQIQGVAKDSWVERSRK